MIAFKIVAIFCAIGVFVYRLRNYLRSIRVCLQLKGPPAQLLIGNTTMLLRKTFLSADVTHAFRRYGRCARAWISIVPAFVLFEPADVQTVLASHQHTDKMFVYRFLHSFLGTGLLTTNGARWQEHRRLIQPAFRKRILDEFVQVFTRTATGMVDELATRPDVAVNVCSVVNVFVLDVLNEAIFGKSSIEGWIDFSESPFRKCQPNMTHRLSNPWLIIDWIFSLTSSATRDAEQTQRMRSFTRNSIAARRLIRLTQSARPSGQTAPPPIRFCLLDFLLQINDAESASFTEADVIEEAITFMLAGQDAVGSAFAFAIHLLAENADCQQRARNEIERLDDDDANDVGGGGDETTPISTTERLGRMRYLEQCIKETLRLYPSVPLIARQLSTPIVLGDGRWLPADSNVLIFPYAVHRMSQYYPDAERFNPARFDADQCEQRPPYAYLPFSGGPRRCIGDRFAMLELQSVLAALLRRFELLPAGTAQRPVLPVFRVTLRASGGLWVHLRPRNAKSVA